MERTLKVSNLKEENTTLGVTDVPHGANYRKHMEVKKP